MKQITITKSGQVTNSAQFPSQEEADAWLARHEGMGTFGQKKETVERQVLIFPAVVDSEGLEISPAQHEIQQVEISGYSVEIVDISAQLEQEAINAAALKLLAETDWMILRQLDSGVACPQEIKDARAVARASIIR